MFYAKPHVFLLIFLYFVDLRLTSKATSSGDDVCPLLALKNQSELRSGCVEVGEVPTKPVVFTEETALCKLLLSKPGRVLVRLHGQVSEAKLLFCQTSADKNPGSQAKWLEPQNVALKSLIPSLLQVVARVDEIIQEPEQIADLDDRQSLADKIEQLEAEFKDVRQAVTRLLGKNKKQKVA